MIDETKIKVKWGWSDVSSGHCFYAAAYVDEAAAFVEGETIAILRAKLEDSLCILDPKYVNNNIIQEISVYFNRNKHVSLGTDTLI